MGKIYKNQGKLRIELDTGTTCTGAVSKRIYYREPSGAEGYFSAGLKTDNETLYHECSNNQIDEAGIWVFWAYVEFSDGRIAQGEPVQVEVYDTGT